VGNLELSTPEDLGRALARAPDPEQARVALSRLGDAPVARELLARADVLEAAIPLLGFSSAVVDFFVKHPDEIASLGDSSARTARALREEATSAVAVLGAQPGLRRFRRRATYRVATRDLCGERIDEVMHELTLIAEAALQAGLESMGPAEPIAVIGMGKLGGRELNYASDVDVIFVHGSPGADGQERANDVARALLALISEPTSDGVALRIDADLRPEGRSGPLSRSLDAMVRYYSEHAAAWERQALLKARSVAGDRALGQAFIDAVEPFVFPAVLPANAVEDVRASKARIEEIVRAQGKERSELKRGRGGIRDVEFAVQLLQLVHGRRHPELRHAGTLPALAALAEAGFVATSDGEGMAGSYRFLRTLEHRLQMVRDLQTHELPRDRPALARLARSMGLDGPDDLRRAYADHTESVRELHERLFYRPLLEAFAESAAPRPGASESDTAELLAGLGFANPAAAYRAFQRIVDPATRLGRVLGGLFPVIAPAVAGAATPDAALIRFERVVDRLRSDWAYQGGAGRHERVAAGDDDGDASVALADRLAARPDAARRLASLVAASSAFADAIVARPSLVSATFESPPAERSLFAGDAELDLTRVAAAYASGELNVPELGMRLAALADAVVSRALDAEPEAVPLTVIGLGRLGREELSFASDLDVLFVFDADDADSFQAANEAAERVMQRVREAGWHIDPDLRPEGRSGPAARSLASYLEYWQRWAETWEYQALLGARFVAGDEALGARLVANARDVAYPESLPMEQVAQIRRMRVRMEEERVRPVDARRFNFKLGYGGLADVQFAVELSLMRHGAAHPAVRRTNTLEALEALAEARLIEGSVALSLGEASTFLTEIKNAMEIERRLPAEALPPTMEGQVALARRLGYGERSRQRFLEDYRRITRKARLAMERVFYPEEEP
jgi:glutamate-ammonia-ligase adenylyltransferase